MFRDVHNGLPSGARLGGMRLLPVLLLAFSMTASAEDIAEEKNVVAVVQKLFDAMAAHDAEAARAVTIPDGRVMAVRGTGKPSNISLEEFAARLSTAKQKYLERMWNPKVLLRGGIAQVWADYDFHFDGKFTHCGIDSFGLIKTTDGWKISAVSYTVETTGCQPSPLGTPGN